MSKSILDLLEEAESKVTAGKWDVEKVRDGAYAGNENTGTPRGEAYTVEDAEFIALARNHMRDLLDVIKAAKYFAFKAETKGQKGAGLLSLIDELEKLERN